MRRLILTLPTPATNIALDEALLDWAEEENPELEFLRIWESPQPLVVVGRSSRVHQEVNEDACFERYIPVLRRSSGGAAIVAGPGCLMYAVVLSYQLRPELKDLGKAHAFVLGRLAEAIGPLVANLGTIEQAGTSDLVLVSQQDRDSNSASRVVLDPGRGGGPPGSLLSVARKFSGNSLRAKRTHLVYHGTLLYDFDLSLIETLLRAPPRTPEYRDGRSHGQFVTNLPSTQQTLVDALDRAWPTDEDVNNWHASRVAKLVAERFSKESWNYEFP